MDALKNQSFLILNLVVFSLLSAVVAGYEAMQAGVVSDGTGFVWGIVFSLVTALWGNNDAKARKTYRPFEYSYFLFLFWPFVLPYHLTKTRGAEGLLMFFGVVMLFLFPFFTGLFVWSYYPPSP